MSLDATPQVLFTTEFALFLVALAGVAFVVLRSNLLTQLTTARAALAAGFVALSATAFAHGSLLVDDPGDAALLAGRAAGWVAVALAIPSWRDPRKQPLAGAVVLGLGSAAAMAAGADDAGAIVQAVAALLLGVALFTASRRTIATRVAASAAATLLLVVLVLSVGLSAVLSNNVEDQAVTALDDRAQREANAIEAGTSDLIQRAGLGVSTLHSERGEALAAIAQGNASAQQRESVRSFLEAVSGIFESLSLAYVDQTAGVIAEVGLQPGDAVKLLGSNAVQDVLRTQSARGAVVVFGDDAFSVGVAPVVVSLPDGRRATAAVVAAKPLDATYLDVRAATDERVALQLRSRSGVVARSSGEHAGSGVSARLAGGVLGSNAARAVDIDDDRFVAAQAVRNVDRAVLALVASRPTTAVDEIRENLFRTFFVIAFGGTLLALLLAALVGDRIGAGVRRLTRSAEALQAGETGVRSGVRTEDEVGVLGATFDAMATSIEEKTEALRQAAADEARLRNRVEAIVAGMGEALIAVDASGTVTDFNEAAQELFGIPIAAARGRALPDVIDAVTEEGDDVAARVESQHQRWWAVGEANIDDQRVPVAFTAAPLRGPQHELAGRVLLVRDLRVEYEAERVKREFLSRVGHELRTPLTPMLGYARLLAGRPVPPERVREISASMVDAGERLGRIIEMLEFFASSQAGRTVLRPERIDLRALLAAAVDERAASSNGHALTRRVRAGTPAVLGDPYWLRRSVEELIDNAIKFSPAGGKVAVTAEPTDGGLVEIAVRDTGVGMSPEEVERAFAEFVQGDESDTRAYGGLGLGLALVQRVAERHGGHVVCQTAPGKGSKFSILLPAVPNEEDDASRRRGRAPRGPSRPRAGGSVPTGGAGGG